MTRGGQIIQRTDKSGPLSWLERNALLQERTCRGDEDRLVDDRGIFIAGGCVEIVLHDGVDEIVRSQGHVVTRYRKWPQDLQHLGHGEVVKSDHCVNVADLLLCEILCLSSIGWKVCKKVAVVERPAHVRQPLAYGSGRLYIIRVTQTPTRQGELANVVALCQGQHAVVGTQQAEASNESTAWP